MRPASKKQINDAMYSYDNYRQLVEAACLKVTTPGVANVVRHIMSDIRKRIEAGDLSEHTNGLIDFTVRILKWEARGAYESGAVHADGTHTLTLKPEAVR